MLGSFPQLGKEMCVAAKIAPANESSVQTGESMHDDDEELTSACKDEFEDHFRVSTPSPLVPSGAQAVPVADGVDKGSTFKDIGSTATQALRELELELDTKARRELQLERQRLDIDQLRLQLTILEVEAARATAKHGMEAQAEIVQAQQRREAAIAACHALTGKRIKMFFAAFEDEDDGMWCNGTIVCFDDDTCEHVVAYDDGDVETHDLSEESWSIVADGSADDAANDDDDAMHIGGDILMEEIFCKRNNNGISNLHDDDSADVLSTFDEDDMETSALCKEFLSQTLSSGLQELQISRTSGVALDTPSAVGSQTVILTGGPEGFCKGKLCKGKHPSGIAGTFSCAYNRPDSPFLDARGDIQYC